jgi:hypothetical protein
MTKSFVAISALIFALVALIHVLRLVQGWHVQLGPTDIPMSVSWVGLAVTAVLATWGAALLRR